MGCFGKGKSEEDKARAKAAQKIEKQLAKDKAQYKGTHRLLLLGE